MSRRKPDADEIEQFIQDLQQEKWLTSSSQAWWPKYIFHYSDITNIVKILKCGKLYSRTILEDSGEFQTDIASKDVIRSTQEDCKKYVRFYFGPRTPTQHSNEGFRPPEAQALESHCPVPVFLLFDSISMLTRHDCKYSNGNIATNYWRLGETAEFLRSLPFKSIYHRRSLYGTSDQEKKEIIFHRNAEVLVENELDLSALKFIVCRSTAEKDTLLNLLPSDIRNRYLKTIIYATKRDLFERKWTFVERVSTKAESISFHFFPDTKTPGPFVARLEIHDPASKEIRIEEREHFIAKGSKELKFRAPRQHYIATLFLNEHLACKVEYPDIWSF